MAETAPECIPTDAGTGRLHLWIGRWIVAAGVATYLAAFIVVIANGGEIRYTADGNETVPVWHSLVPVLVGVILALLVTPGSRAGARMLNSARTLRIQAMMLLAVGVAFTVSLSLWGADEPRYALLKISLLLVVPVVILSASLRRNFGDARTSVPGPTWRPLVPAAGWAGCFLVLSVGRPTTFPELDIAALVVALTVGFLINAVVEELFYRRWLQTRWQQVLGGVWPAIVLSSILWASWHIAIQGRGHLALDLANVIANHGVTGLFFGLLWSRYRRMWPLLVLHGLMNANPITLLQSL